ncbi:hypothetical protein [Idiomarina abyssalis]|uniref:hypothetical protein n=1 Tax=Idiomarina abyssalis TaxID=86102 RepID=UPI003A92D14D
MEPYESIYVGNFIFTLGYLTKEKGITLSSQSASLMAQNVGDEVVADLISGWGGKNFVIEFKRNEKSVRSEFGKDHKKELIRQLREESIVKALASRGHFIGYGDFELSEDNTGLYFSQYHKIQDGEAQTDDRLTLSDFIFKVVMGDKWGLTDNELGKYIDILASAFTFSGSGGGGQSSAMKAKRAQEMSSLIINYNEKESEINFVTCNLSKARELTLEPKLELKPNEQTISRGYNGSTPGR